MDPQSSSRPQSVEGSSMFLGGSDVAISGGECSNAGRDVAKIVVQNYNILPGIEAGSSKQDRAQAAGRSLETAHSPSPWYSMNRLIRALKVTQDQETEGEQKRCETATASGSKRACQPKLKPIADIIDLLHIDVATNQQTAVKNEACTILPINAGNLNSIPEIYTHHMLIHALGYPLYIPEPEHGLSREHQKRGVRIGDVGSITPEGAFDFLFNICVPADHPINPFDLPNSFEMLPSRPSDISIIPEYISPGDCRYSDGVLELDDRPNKFRCTASEGAVLVLQGGATLFKAKNTPIFQDFAARHAENWYKYMIDKGRNTPNGSIYLITGCIKSRNWANATFYRGPSPGNYAQLVTNDAHCPALSNVQPAYRWTKFGKISPRTGPRSEETEELNQCEFLYGYKIILRQGLLDKLSSTVSVPSQESQHSPPRSTKAPASNRDCGTGASTSSSTEPHLEDENTSSQSHNSCFLGDVIIEADLPTEPPLHPSDLINITLLESDPSAKVAITHDAVWCQTFFKLKFATSRSYFTIDDILDVIAEKYRSTTDKFGCISLAGEIRDGVNVYKGHCDDEKMIINDHLKNTVTTTTPNVSESLHQVKQASDVHLKKVTVADNSGNRSTSRGGKPRVILNNRFRGKVQPKYILVKRSGPDHSPMFTYEVQVNGTIWGKGTGSNKAAAMDEAALNAIYYGDESGCFLQLAREPIPAATVGASLNFDEAT